MGVVSAEDAAEALELAREIIEKTEALLEEISREGDEDTRD